MKSETSQSSGTRGRPNFLVIITDQWNPRVFGYAGHPMVRTPRIDGLVAGGMNFARMYASNPRCMASRAMLFTGLTPRVHRVRMNGIPLDPRIPTFTAAQIGPVESGRGHLSQDFQTRLRPHQEITTPSSRRRRRRCGR